MKNCPKCKKASITTILQERTNDEERIIWWCNKCKRTFSVWRKEGKYTTYSWKKNSSKIYHYEKKYVTKPERDIYFEHLLNGRTKEMAEMENINPRLIRYRTNRAEVLFQKKMIK